MMRRLRSAILVPALLALGVLAPATVRAQTPGPRLALVIGEAGYRVAPLATAANDAALLAQTLQDAGFEVTGGANLDQGALRQAVRAFLAKAEHAGAEATVFVYVAGRGVQYDGENYFVPVDATIARDIDVPVEAMRMSDLTGALATMPLRARIVVLDGARPNGFARTGPPLAGGLALTEPTSGMLEAFNAAPGSVAPEEPGPYGVYAVALAEMLRDGGVPIETVFDRVRLRVHAESRGAVVPWDAANLGGRLDLLAAPPNMPAPALRGPLGDLSASEAYGLAVERDTLAGYQAFLARFGGDPLAARIRVLLAARREALTWARTVAANTPNAYWTYMRRYPRGLHIPDARRLLAALAAPLEPPPRFDVYVYEGLPPPPDAETQIADRPVRAFDLGGSPPPPPDFLLPPRRAEFDRLPPPAAPPGPDALPVPAAIPLPFGRPPGGPGRLEPPNLDEPPPAPHSAPPRPPAADHPVSASAPAAAPPASPATPGGSNPPPEASRAAPTMVPVAPPPHQPGPPAPVPAPHPAAPAARPAPPPPAAAVPMPPHRPSAVAPKPPPKALPPKPPANSAHPGPQP